VPPIVIVLRVTPVVEVEVASPGVADATLAASATTSAASAESSAFFMVFLTDEAGCVRGAKGDYPINKAL
jgi:hypothetical protein